MVVTSALLQFYYTSNDYTWFMFYLVIAGLFVSFALSFTAIVVLIRLLKRLEDLLAKLNQLLPESDEEFFLRPIVWSQFGRVDKTSESESEIAGSNPTSNQPKVLKT